MQEWRDAIPNNEAAICRLGNIKPFFVTTSVANIALTVVAKRMPLTSFFATSDVKCFLKKYLHRLLPKVGIYVTVHITR